MKPVRADEGKKRRPCPILGPSFVVMVEPDFTRSCVAGDRGSKPKPEGDISDA